MFELVWKENGIIPHVHTSRSPYLPRYFFCLEMWIFTKVCSQIGQRAEWWLRLGRHPVPLTISLHGLICESLPKPPSKKALFLSELCYIGKKEKNYKLINADFLTETQSSLFCLAIRQEQTQRIGKCLPHSPLQPLILIPDYSPTPTSSALQGYPSPKPTYLLPFLPNSTATPCHWRDEKKSSTKLATLKI